MPTRGRKSHKADLHGCKPIPWDLITCMILADSTTLHLNTRTACAQPAQQSSARRPLVVGPLEQAFTGLNLITLSEVSTGSNWSFAPKPNQPTPHKLFSRTAKTHSQTAERLKHSKMRQIHCTSMDWDLNSQEWHARCSRKCTSPWPKCAFQNCAQMVEPIVRLRCVLEPCALW